MEIWKDIDGTNGMYQVSNKGNVKSVDRVKRVFNFMSGEYVDVHFKEKVLAKTVNHSGYQQVHIPRGLGISNQVHRLVAEAFIEIPEELLQYKGTQKLQINHKDENKTNNIVENLEWCTAQYNSNYGTRNERMGNSLAGRRPSDATIMASVERCSRMVSKYSLAGEYIDTYPSLAEAARQNGVFASNITKCCDGSGRLKSTGGFKWKYADS